MKKSPSLALLVAASLASPVHAVIIADLDVDVGAWSLAGGHTGPNALPDGWTFNWNPTGQQLVGGTWEAIAPTSADDFKVPTSTSDGEVTYSSLQRAGFNNNDNATNGAGNVYGGTNSVLSTDGFNHYSLATYTVQAGEDGIATIDTTDSGGNSTTGEHVILHNGAIISSIVGLNGRTMIENVSLMVGDTVSFGYVNLTQDQEELADYYVDDLTAVSKNNTRWYAQGTIDIIPEPSVFALCSLGVFGLLARRRH